ncbi:MAG: HsdR family type I site-specific deoxyribonuclease [Candidatus Paceibacterota bacterium]
MLPSFLEEHISQIPALQFLQQLGWKYLPPDKAVALRGGKLSSVLLDTVLIEQLKKLNRIRFKGEEHPFSEANIHSAVQALKNVVYDGLVRTNEKVYDLLVLGKSLPQTIAGDTRSFPVNFIDWNPDTWLKNNVFHVSDEFVVERTASHETRRPDIVLFVNGIPLVMIECKRPDAKDPVASAISQHIGNQREDQIPHLHFYSQLLLGIAKNDAAYGTTGTPPKFWSVWKEDVDASVKKILGKPSTKMADTKWLLTRFNNVSEKQADYFTGPRTITNQDRALYSLCRPERVLDLAFSFTIFDAGEKKVARYQQYFTVKNTLRRIQERDESGARKGGVVWHTQGSGKSLTMVMLAKEIARLRLPDYKIVLVTDRVDLDDQIYRTFTHCDMEPTRANSGRHLAKLLQGSSGRVITTVIDKFENALLKGDLCNECDNVFVLVDESHRGQYKMMHSRMRKALPKACFIGFTGTPVRKKEKNTIDKFGGLIQPTYTIRTAVEDKAVVPLLYEGRDVDQRVDRESIDRWFEIVTTNLSKQQKADLKKKFTTTDQLNKAEQKVREIALDISLHYRDNWQGTQYKAQLVAQDKATALLYHRFLHEFGMVSSEVLISGPDDREGNEEVDIDQADLPEIQRFWKRMMAKHGSEDQYNKNVINAFKAGDSPEIVIVVDKLLTGFDAPRNTVLYLARVLKDHTLLQAIARVNRLCEGKDFGYIIDYRGVLSNLKKAFDFYNELEKADQQELESSLTDVAEEIEKLPRRHTDLLNLFQDIKNKQDEELHELKLADDELRERFYDALRDYAKSLSMALGSLKFMEQTPDAKVERYRSDLQFFMQLRSSVRRRYAEIVDFKEYEAKIQKLLDTHVATGGVQKVTSLVNIFEKEAFDKELEELDGKSTASKADTIAHRTKRTIHDRMDDDPAFYSKFSKMLEDAIEAFRQKRLSDAEYLAKTSEIADAIRTRRGAGLPDALQDHQVAQAFFGIVREVFTNHDETALDTVSLGAAAALRIDEIIRQHKIVNWTKNMDVQNQMQNAVEDYLHELEPVGLDLSFDEIDMILEKCLDVARRRYAT